MIRHLIVFAAFSILLAACSGTSDSTGDDAVGEAQSALHGDPHNPKQAFNKPVPGTNGRSCSTCHIKGDGFACCGIVLDPELVVTRAQPRRAFQGWRYLPATDAPADLRVVGEVEGDMPQAMRANLRELRLIDS